MARRSKNSRIAGNAQSGVAHQRRVRLSVVLTEKEAAVFFTLLAMSTCEQTDVDFNELAAIEEKFVTARNKPNS